MEASLLGGKKIITLTKAQYDTLSSEAKAADVMYYITDDTTPGTYQNIITASGVLQGDGEGNITTKVVDNAPTTNSSNLVTSGGVASAIAAVCGFAQAEEILSNSDLNDYTSPGVFYCVSGTVAATLSNTPITNAGFTMYVNPSSTIGLPTQIIFSSVSTLSRIYIRRKYNTTTWYDWFSPARITGATETSFNGVLAGNGSTVEVKPVDTTPTANSSNLVTSGAVKSALDSYGCEGQVLTALKADSASESSATYGAKIDAFVASLPNGAAAKALGFCPALYGKGNYLIEISKVTSNYIGVTFSSPYANTPGGFMCKDNGVWGDFVQFATNKSLDELPYINQNLLCNGYWNGIGSQAGAGNFPINTQGSLNYSAGQYTIDRWYLYNAGYVRVNFQGTQIGVRLESTTSAAGILRQAIPVDGLKGKTVTFSIYNAVTNYGDENLKVIIGLGNDSTGAVSSGLGQAHLDRVTQLTVTIPSDTQYKYLAVFIYLPARESTGNAILLRGCKLEIGDKSTLGEWNGTEFVFRDPPPDYAFEVARCRTDVADPNDTKANDSFAFMSDLDALGNEVTTGSNNIRAFKAGHLVMLRFYDYLSAGATETFQLPDSIKPSTLFHGIVSNNYANKFGLITITTTGELNMVADDYTQYYYGTVTYLAK